MASPSIIGRGTTVRGNVQGDDDLDIQGRVEGSVAVKGELVIGEGALIKSDVSARRVLVRGAVAGNIRADESIVLEQGARVVGDLGAPSIGIRPGALVRGNVSTDGAPAPAARARTEAAARPAATPARAPQRPAARPAAAPAPAARPAAKANGGAAKPAAAVAPPPAPAAKAGPPPPIVPSLKKGAKGALKRKGAR